jgi:RimJ/RimL family protein N-acetyltransferase
MGQKFQITSLHLQNTTELVALLRSQSSEYVRFFTPFRFDHATVLKLLTQRDQDLFFGIYWQERLIGFSMLRGWDEGYEVPAYGVLIDEKYSGYGLATLTLRLVKAVCRLRGSPAIMLKVHPANTRATKLFERAGFFRTGIDAESGGFIYRFNFNGL